MQMRGAPVCGMPVAIGAGRDMALGVALIPDVHVALHALSPFCAVSVKYLDLCRPCDRQECIPCTCPNKLACHQPVARVMSEACVLS